MSEIKAWVTVTARLECGCAITHTLSSTHAVEQLEKLLRLATDCFPHHFDRTQDAHDCELVSEDNPNGTPPKREH